jgi:surface antigen/NADPH-dependent curcumin reductase CurA
MKKIILGILVMMLIYMGSTWQPKAVNAADTIIGDDYPAKWKNLPLGATTDNWKMATRYCTSFVANRLSVVNKFDIRRDGLDWNANQWGNNAKIQGYKVDMNPKRGSVAYWSAKYHVAWVAAVDGNRVLIEEYNYDYNGNYNSRWINKNAVDGYIHFKDMSPTLPPIDLTNYFTVNPQKVAAKVNSWVYNDKDTFSTATQSREIKKDEMIDVVRIEYSSTGYPRLVTREGYVSANKNYFVRLPDNIDDYITTTQRLVTKENIWVYSNKDTFSAETQVVQIPKDTMIEVKSITFSKDGWLRLVTDQGYVSANKNYVKPVLSNINDYITTAQRLVTKENIWVYSNKDTFSAETQVVQIPKDTMIEVKSIIFSKDGWPRLVTDQGYVSANKNYVKPVLGNIDDYITTAQRLVTKENIWVYSNKDTFSAETQVVQIPKDTMIEVKSIVFSKDGWPRLVTDQGYVSANKNYVKPMIDNIDQYITNIGKVEVKQDIWSYNDKDIFATNTQSVQIRKGTILTVQSIIFSKDGWPRLVTDQGYVSANKNYVNLLN